MKKLASQDCCEGCEHEFTMHMTSKVSIAGGRAKDRYPHNVGLDRIMPGSQNGLYIVKPVCNLQLVSSDDNDVLRRVEAPSWPPR